MYYTCMKRQPCNVYFQVAKALQFLSQLKYVHRDIAARNCLGELYIQHYIGACVDVHSYLLHIYTIPNLSGIRFTNQNS